MGTIRGVVRDQQSAVTPGATVTVRNVDTNVARTATADENGQFLVTNLPVGAYELTVELAGFTKYVRSGLTLAVNQDAVVDVTMQTGAVAETVMVTSDASILNTTTSEVGVRFDTKRGRRAPGDQQPRRLQPGALGGGREPARERPVGVRRRHQLRGQRHARPVEQLHD